MTNVRSYSHAFAGGTVNRANDLSGPVNGASTLGRPGILNALAGAMQDRITVWRLNGKSDRVLADIGLSRDTLAADVKAARLASVPAAVEREPATGLYGVLEAAFEAVTGAVRDAATAHTLRRRSDRVLADMGLGRDTLRADIAARRRDAAAARGALVSQRLTAWREEQRIYRELAGYSDAELTELGMGRADIRAAARGHAVMLFRDAGLVDGYFSTDGRPVAANGAHLRRVA